MRSAVRAAAALATACLFLPATAQTYSNCNPTLRSDCPVDSALGKTVNIDFSSASDSFTETGTPTYGTDGVSLTVAKSGDSPMLTSKWYIMFGKVEVTLRVAPGAGIVSSFVMQSDDLDEIDWEWLGGDPDQAQSNYFGKGQTTSYTRGAFHPDVGGTTTFKTYAIEWTSTQIIWSIDGVTARTLVPADAEGQYPQTPMQVKVGVWSGGDTDLNEEGTVTWSLGPTIFSDGPFTMNVKSMKVSDYSTGTTYSYGDMTGSWESIESDGGEINSGGGSPVEEDAPAVTSAVVVPVIPLSQPKKTSVQADKSTADKSSAYPYVASSTLSTAPSATLSNYPGLPSGWTVTDSGKVVPPSAAPSTSRRDSSTLSSAASPSPSGVSESYQVITTYDDRGFTTVYTIAAAASAAPKSYDDQGFLITPAHITPALAQAQDTPASSTSANFLKNNALESKVPSVPLAVSDSSAGTLLASSVRLLVLLAACISVFL